MCKYEDIPIIKNRCVHSCIGKGWDLFMHCFIKECILAWLLHNKTKNRIINEVAFTFESLAKSSTATTSTEPRKLCHKLQSIMLSFNYIFASTNGREHKKKFERGSAFLVLHSFNILKMK